MPQNANWNKGYSHLVAWEIILLNELASSLAVSTNES